MITDRIMLYDHHADTPEHADNIMRIAVYKLRKVVDGQFTIQTVRDTGYKIL